MRATRSNINSQNAYTEQDLNYFDPSVGQTHSVRGLSEVQQPLTPSHQMSNSINTTSPPPTSATTSGSTSTPASPAIGGPPTSLEGTRNQTESGAGFRSTALTDTSPDHLEQLAQNEGHWPFSLSDRTISQHNASPPQMAPPSDEQDLSHSPGGPHNVATYPSAVKLLVSNNVAGSIIGRAGQTISELQSESCARIKLSQTGDYFPGTQDRVCLVQGQPDNVKLAVKLLLERFYALQEQQHTQHLAWQPKPNEPSPMGFDFVVRLLVPSSSCGMIIGKSGSNIKQMEEASGVSSVRLSPKESGDPPSPSAAAISATSERIVTLTGPTLESCVMCLYIILDGMVAHHDICRYTNMTTSYSRVVMHGAYGGVPGASVPGRPHFIVPSSTQEASTWDSGNTFTQFAAAKRSSSSPDLTGQVLWDQRIAPRMTLESTGTSPAPMSRPPPPREPMQPPYTTGFTEGPQSYSHDVPPMMSSPARLPVGNANAANVYLLDQSSLSNSISAPDLLTLQLHDSLRINAAISSSAMEYTHFAPQLPQPTPPGFTAQILVPDTLIGSILGRGGRTLNELQMHSNTRIRISQRGEYVPGTRNRVVTIRGPTAHSVSLAQFLMSQRMVLPPTATFSNQQSFHPSTIQSQYTSHPSQQPQPAHRQGRHSPYQHGSSVESTFQGPESHAEHPQVALSKSGSSKELTHS